MKKTDIIRMMQEHPRLTAGNIASALGVSFGYVHAVASDHNIELPDNRGGKNGRPRTVADVVEQILRESPELTTEEIARTVGTSESYVLQIQKKNGHVTGNDDRRRNR